MNNSLTIMDNWFEEFLKWIEGTNLFRLIRDNPYADRIEGISTNEMFSLERVKGMKIERATDLPFPIILNFLKNYSKVPSRTILDKNTIKLGILKLILEDGATIEDFIDVVVEGNGIVGVGLITLGEKLDEYCKSKIRS